MKTLKICAIKINWQQTKFQQDVQKIIAVFDHEALAQRMLLNTKFWKLYKVYRKLVRNCMTPSSQCSQDLTVGVMYTIKKNSIPFLHTHPKKVTSKLKPISHLWRMIVNSSVTFILLAKHVMVIWTLFSNIRPRLPLPHFQKKASCMVEPNVNWSHVWKAVYQLMQSHQMFKEYQLFQRLMLLFLMVQQLWTCSPVAIMQHFKSMQSMCLWPMWSSTYANVKESM